ncbi:DNA (cytosine-5-)-methyltransferase [Bacillus cereus]|uniref:DNA (cytosine-5-)-methyltransferase n=1 Tax=Bacillus cereus TaxID=1396 RepID=UPI002410E5F5|nr:DNA (cytosine-5-)-methyltransferase [Bacillus cereus]
MSLTFIDLFAGIGGFRLGMEQAGHKCLGYVEIDKFARKSYEAIHNTKGEWTAHDITTVTDDDLRLLRGQVDVICGGFPCQAFSIAGKRLGFAETRGTLFFEIARLAKEIQPQYLFLENVKGLLNHDGGNTFRTILSTLDELGYDAEWRLLNSKDFGVPQNRERVFIIGHLRGRSRREVFPIGSSYREVSNVQGQQIYANTLTTRTGQANGTGSYILEREQHEEKVNVVGMLDIKGKDQIRRVYGTDGISPCLTTMQGGGQEPKILAVRGRYRECGPIEQQAEFRKDNLTNTLTTVAKDNYLMNDYRIRKLTPRECWRLQGFPDWAFEKAREVNSDAQLYKQAGNSVTVPVIYEIAKRLV